MSLLWRFFLGGLFFPIALHAEEKIIHFHPQGTATSVRQAVARFSSAMTSLSDPFSPPSPFVVDCPPGKGRWVDIRTWVYDFDKELAGGVICHFHLKDDVKTLAREPLGGQRDFSFDTGGPLIDEEAFWGYEGENDTGISEDQIFILPLLAPATKDSIEANAFCRIEGVGEKIGVEVLDKKTLPHIEDLSDTRIGVRCRRAFPSGARVSLVWGKGISSPSGIPTSTTQTLGFNVREAFSASLTCTRENPNRGCSPVTPITVNFSAPISLSDARAIRLKAEGKVFSPELGDQDGWVESVSFAPPFPEATALKLFLPESLKDDASRPLANASRFPLEVKVEEAPPLAKFPSSFGILESKEGGILPLSVRNLEKELRFQKMEKPSWTKEPERGETLRETAVLAGEAMEPLLPQAGKRYLEEMKGRMLVLGSKRREDYAKEDKEIMAWLGRIEQAAWHEMDCWRCTPSREYPLLPLMAAKSGGKTQDFSIPNPAGEHSLEVIGIPLKNPGFYVVEIESQALGAALLDRKAPMFVRTSALVTNMAAHFKHGRESSLVWVTTLDRAEPVKGADILAHGCDGVLLWQGKTNGNGVAKIEKELQPGHCPEGFYGVFISARKDNDMTFVRSEWDEGIEPWRFNLSSSGRGDPFLAHAILDRALFRRGETVHMKHLWRKKVGQGFALGEEPMPQEAILTHLGSGEEVARIPLSWDGQGAAQSAWNIPKEAKLGRYGITLKRDEGSSRAGEFEVGAFRVPLMQGQIDMASLPLIGKDEAEAGVVVRYLSGGGASGLDALLRWSVDDASYYFPDYEGYAFARGKVEEGLKKKEDKGHKTQSIPFVLDDAGSAKVKLSGIPRALTPQEITAELEYMDPNGEIQTVARTFAWWPSPVVLGIKPDGWAASKEKVSFRVAAVDPSGKPISGARVEVEFLKRQTFSHRKRLVGGFYAYENEEKIERLGRACAGKTDRKGILHCIVPAPASGNLILQASSGDAVTHDDIWVAGKEDWWFSTMNDDRMDVIPEEKRLEPGDKAVLQVRMPFRRATALVTLEREGVLDYRIENLSGKEPIVRLPIRGAYAPNVYASVLAVRGRVGEVKPTGIVDLGRPAFKLGLAELFVGWKAHELKVKVMPEKETYPVRARAKARIEVKTADGKPLPGKAEAAVAVVDEGLLQLAPNPSWQVLREMMGLRSEEVLTSTAAMQVVGKRHYGKKAAPPGGGGGASMARELFDTLLLWQAKVPLDKGGRADVEIPLNDSLTGFTVAALATAGIDRFGEGYASIRTHQDVMLFSGLPPLVREDDKIEARFSLRNASQKEMRLKVKAKVWAKKEGKTKEDAALPDFPPREITLASQKMQDIAFSLAVPGEADALMWELEAQDEEGKRQDAIRISQKVIPAHPVRVWQEMLMQLNTPAEIPVAPAEGALPGRSFLQVALSPSLGKNLEGVRRYMAQYPYGCLEQQVSRALVLEDQEAWEGIRQKLPAYLDEAGFLKYWPTSREGSDVLSSYALSVTHEAGLEMPQRVRDRVLEALSGFVEGKLSRASLMGRADETVRKLSAIAALARFGRATKEMLEPLDIIPEILPTSALLDWMEVLERLPDIPERARKMEQAQNLLRTRIYFSGTRLGFSQEDRDKLHWLMVSADVNATRALLLLRTNPAWHDDVGKLALGLLSRRENGHWDTTTANAWGFLAMKKFSAAFEATPVQGKTKISLDKEEKPFSWAEHPQGGKSLFGLKAQGKLTLAQEGKGAPWVTLSSLAARPLLAPVASGMRIEKSLIPVARKDPAAWHVGDVLRVRLKVVSSSDMSFVVVNDPIPAGASILGGIKRSSLLQEDNRQGLWPEYEERDFDAYRAYYSTVPQGEFSLEYTLRLNQAGAFQLPQTRAEALYFPELYGEVPNPVFEVLP